MIQVYSPNNTNYTKNGNVVLLPEEAQIVVELNGAWEATLIHPIDEEGRWEYLVDNAVVKMPSWNGEQLFRIRTKDKSDFEGVICILDPIFFDAAQDCFLEDVRPTNKNGQQALDIMTAVNTKYTGVSNITVVNTAYYEYMNLLEAISGEQDNSFLNRWGGEIEYDNYTIRINSRLGSDRGVEFRYGRNIQGVTESVDMTDVVTRIYPKAFNGRKLSTKYVNSSLINSYPTVRAKEIEFDNIIYKDDLTEGDLDDPSLIICNTQAELDAALGSACQYQFDAGIDKPVVTITIEGIVPDFVEFQNVTLGLGDTVYLRHPVLDIVTEARIVGLTYDAIREEVTGVTIGSVAYNYFNNVSSAMTRIETAVRPDGSVRAETVKGIVDMMKANLYAQYDQAEAQDVVGILFENNDSTSQLYGAMAIGTQGFMIADTKDANGNWNWNTWGTAKGLNANYIVAGTILATMIHGGTLTLGGLNNEDGILQILDASENVIGTINNSGATINGTFTSKYGTEWMKMIQSVLMGGSTEGTTDGTLDLSANSGGTIWTVLRAITGGLQLASDNSYIHLLAGSEIQEIAETNAFRTATTGAITDTADTAVFEIAGTSKNETAGTYILESAGTYIKESAGTYILEEAVDYKRVSSGTNKDCYVIVGNDTNGRRIDLHADTGTYIKIDDDNDKLETWASDFTFQNATLGMRLAIPSFSSLPVTFYDSHIHSNHYVVESYLTNPAAQIGDWTITTASGSVTISGSISGTTAMSLLLTKPIQDVIPTTTP